MRILIVRQMEAITDSRVTKESQSLLKGGHVVSILDWDRGSKHGAEVSYLKTSCGTIKRITFGYPAPFGAGPRRNFLSYWKFLHFVRRYIKKNHQEYDVFHLCDLTVMYPVRKILIKRKKKFVYDIFDYFPDSRKWPGSIRRTLVKMETKCIDSASAVAICSESRIKQIGDAKPKKLVVIHNSPNLQSVVESPENDGGQKVKIVYVGYLDASRFVDKIVEAVDSNPALELHIGGSGPLEEAIKEIASKNERIIFYGKLPYQSVLELESKCDLLMAFYDSNIPNNRYAAPNKFYESLALGKPILMAKGTGFDDFFQKHNFGITVVPTREGIEAGVAKLISVKNQWPSFSKEEQELFKSSFSWEIMESRLLRIYKELSEEKEN
jgi:glycosyltransferase involved in cell wall biosynthesis